MIAQRTFSHADQLAFAALSGDFNPLHVDPVLARRTPFGEPVVHGVHLLLWAMASIRWSGVGERLAFSRITAAFRKPAKVGTTLTLEMLPDSGFGRRCRIMGGEGVCATMTFTPAITAQGGSPAAPASEFARACRKRTLAACEGASGMLDLVCAQPRLEALFPTLAGTADYTMIASLLAVTRLVGMECPGLHSVLIDVDLRFDMAPLPAPAGAGMQWRSESVDQRFAMVSLAVTGPRVAGTVNAMVRPAPAAQLSFADLRGLIADGVFSGQRALVVGGSRGLGEATAKLFAAAGGAVAITYHRGAVDAERVRQEIVAGGGEATTVALDVCDQASIDAAVSRMGSAKPPSHLFYFATPPISLGRRGVFSDALFDLYQDVYVRGLERVVEALAAGGAAPLKIFYPSTCLLDEIGNPDAAEYRAAKKIGEARASEIAGNLNASLSMPRLPRLATDQTLGLPAAMLADAASVLAPLLAACGDTGARPATLTRAPA